MTAQPGRNDVPGTAFLDPKVLATIGNLELLARSVVDGFLHGLHRSTRLGLSMEFAEHRPYMPGDDIRRIDWRVFARTDRFHVKEYEAETNAAVTLLVDISPSMAWSSGGVTKLDYGRFLAAALAWFSARQRDRIGLVTFDADLVDTVPCSTRHLRPVLHAIDRIRAGRQGSIRAPLRRFAERAPRRGLVVVISDLYEDPAAISDAIGLLRATGSEILMFHLLDPAELTFPFDLAATFEDVETGDRLPVIPDDMRARYREQMERHLTALRQVMASARVDYAVIDTSRPLDFALREYLTRRQEQARTR